MGESAADRIAEIIKRDHPNVYWSAKQDFENSILTGTIQAHYTESGTEYWSATRAPKPNPGEMDRLVAEAETFKERLESVS